MLIPYNCMDMPYKNTEHLDTAPIVGERHPSRLERDCAAISSLGQAGTLLTMLSNPEFNESKQRESGFTPNRSAASEPG